MRVLQVNAVYEYGSTGRIIKELHNFLLSQGVDSYVATPNKYLGVKNSIRIGHFIDHKLHALFSRLVGLQGYFSYLSTLLFIRKLKKIDPDIIHLHNLHSNYINLPLLLRYIARRDISTVVTLHDCWFYTGHCCHYINYNCFRWQSEGCHDCIGIKDYNRSLFFDFSRKKFRDKQTLFRNIRRVGVIGVSDWITREVKGSILKDSKIIKRVYNWIDLDVFYPRNNFMSRMKCGFSGGDFIILGVAQMWSEDKGLSVFIEIANIYPNYKIVLVGCYEGNRDLPSNILMIGEVVDVDMLAEFYSIADLFVNPSIQESFGKVSVEALSCGTPIIVNNATANSELLGEGCGYLVEGNRVDEYVSHIATIRRKGKKYYSSKCVEFSQKFRSDKLLIEHLDFYNLLRDDTPSL